MHQDITDGVIRARPGQKSGLAHAALALGGFSIGTAEFATMSFLPAFTAELGVEAPAGGHVVSAYALGVVLGAPVLAMFGARLERRRLLALLLGWFALGNMLSAFAPSLGSLVALRFLTAIPHGAYLGTAVLVAADMVPGSSRAHAVGRVLMGLALATTVGVPLASLLSQWLGWRAGFGAIGALTLLAMTSLLRVVPTQMPAASASARRELGALRRPQVWLALGMGAVGFGGLFCVYTYLASTLSEATQATDNAVPIILAVFGAGIACGNVVAPYLARHGVMFAAGVLLTWSAAALALYPLSIYSPWSIGLAVFAIGVGGGLGAVLQMRLMDVAGDAQNLAASLNHVAFNIANALGPWLGGLAIAAGLGWGSTGWVGCALALGGLAVWLLAAIAGRQRGG
ncbi:MFS transporter [Rhodanobacter caeni]|uniref:MFS transporter n=1 Tax=Rhodanobacter caeni TaxID=657654 RepID=A0ABN0UXE9_9GAMM